MSGGYGRQGPVDSSSDFLSTSFLVKQLLGRANTATIVQVQKVYPGGIGPVGFLDAIPQVNQVDGIGRPTPHETVFGLPFFRLQGGVNAVIIDPQPGDLGIAIIADHDISGVKQNKAQSNPGSRRRFSLSDGMYVGGLLNGTPTCYVAFINGGITMSPDGGTTSLTITPGRIRMVAAEINTHATGKNTWDAGGTGFVYQPGEVDTYTNGVPSTSNAPNPPEVPT